MISINQRGRRDPRFLQKSSVSFDLIYLPRAILSCANTRRVS